MTISLSQATSAYAHALKSTALTQPDATTATPTGGGSFADLVKSSLTDAIDAQHQGEQLSMKAATGKADLTQVVTAVTNAEVTLQTVVAVRDKVVTAYQDILRMAI
ncbi:MAG TPA: flagellar hook-basal body complex protein FliE [Stellaceae bacterium]|nr:flagellar hook-basal body complex protein FliE [Stellaceae bacterium]